MVIIAKQCYLRCYMPSDIRPSQDMIVFIYGAATYHAAEATTLPDIALKAILRRRLLVTGLPGPAGVLPNRGMQHRDRLGERDGHVGVDGGLAGHLGCLASHLDQPLRGGVRFGGRQPGQVIGELGIASPGSS